MTYSNNLYTMTSFKNVCQPTNCALVLHNIGPSIVQIRHHRNPKIINPSRFISFAFSLKTL